MEPMVSAKAGRSNQSIINFLINYLIFQFKKMTTKKTTTIMLAIALALGFTACNKNEVTPIDRTVKSVTLSIANANMEARSVEAPVTATTTNIVKNALLLFTNGTADASVIEKSVPVTAADIAKMLATTAANKGYKVDGVPNSSTAVMVVLNAPATVTAAGIVGKNVGAVKAAVLTLNNMNAKAAVADANTTGSITMTGTPVALVADAATAGFGPGATAADFYANVTVAPVVSRFELIKVEAKTGSQIKSFKVDGVFVKKFNQTTTLGGAAAAMVDYSNVKAGAGQTLNAKFYTQADGTYAGADKNMRNLGAAAITFDATHVAGYQVAAAAAPWIVVKISDITLQDDSKYNDGKANYVVIKGYKDGATDVATFVANNVYKLDASGTNGIDVNNITEDVDAVQKSVWVGVTITPWTVKNVAPVYN